MVTDQFTPLFPSPSPAQPPQWTKQPNILLFIVKEWIRLLQYWLQRRKEGPSFTRTTPPKREELAAEWSLTLIFWPAW